MYNLGPNYTGLSAGTNDISQDPKLEYAFGFGKYRLKSNSPCINSGNDADVQASWLDMDGQARTVGEHVDIGADEYDGTVGSSPPVIRVSPTGNDANDGSSWPLAKRTVQAGINTATFMDAEVWVAEGTYWVADERDINNHNFNELITLRPFAHLYGGFAGTETQRDQRDFKTHITILDGQQQGSVITAKAGHLLSRIDGFTIRNGASPSGGGISCNYSSPIISNNTITGNNAASNGGGISCNYSFSPIINNTISGNIASSGDGGGISCDHSSPTIHNNTVSGNSAYFGGGLYCNNYSSPTIINNTITGNNASGGNGGGIFCDSFSSSTAIANNIIAFNSTGIYNLSGNGTLVLRNNCVFNPGGANYMNLSAGTGDINQDPMLEYAYGFGRYHLKSNSPCMNTGNDADVQTDWLDMDGQPRIVGEHVDIGADEYDGTVWTYNPPVIRVSPSGNDANDGSSWALAKRTVQVGINAASVVDGQVWVAEGSYHEQITLRAFAHLYGGFAGTETQRDQRNWKDHPTILDGYLINGSVVSFLRIYGYNSSGIDGFTIRNGGATYGGGISCEDSSPIISNNTISGNTASSYGGGIFL